jgi:hypothetical protein
MPGTAGLELCHRVSCLMRPLRSRKATEVADWMGCDIIPYLIPRFGEAWCSVIEKQKSLRCSQKSSEKQLWFAGVPMLKRSSFQDHVSLPLFSDLHTGKLARSLLLCSLWQTGSRSRICPGHFPHYNRPGRCEMPSTVALARV